MHLVLITDLEITNHPLIMYVLDKEKQEQLLQDLVVESSEEDGWMQRLVHPATGEMWSMYYPYSWVHGGGPRFLRKEPVPADPATWALKCVASGVDDEAIGAAHDLSLDPEMWDTIISALEREQTTLPKDQLVIFIEDLGILDPVNRRSTLNKTVGEIEQDAAHFKTLSERAARLIAVG